MRPIESLESASPQCQSLKSESQESREARVELELSAPERSFTRCGVCGFAEIRTDEVFDGRPLLLGECPRCEHRWTLAPLRRLSLPLVVAVRSPRPARPAPEEPAAAA